MASYEYTGINESATISVVAKNALADAQGIAVAIDNNGAFLPAAEGDPVAGIAIVSNDEAVAAGGRLDIQIKDVGLWKAGAPFSAGTLLMANAAGKAVTATSGKQIVGRALTAAVAAGDLAQVQILNAGATV